MRRFGYVIRMGGDAEISGALAAGIDAGTRNEVRQAASEAVRRVAMMQHTPEEWAEMIEDARVIYGGNRYTPKPLKWLLIVYAMLCSAVDYTYRYLSAWNRE